MSSSRPTLPGNESKDHVAQCLSASSNLVEITLDNNKTYIGFPLEIGMLSRSGKSDVSILPMLSGYRHPKTKELKTTTDYAPVLERLYRDKDAAEEDFRVVVPATAIMSARPFSLDLFNEFNQYPHPQR